MAYDFPASPILNQTFNNYVWDGEKWKLQSPPVTGAVRYDIAQSLNSTQRSQARANIDVTRKNYIINGAMMISQENGSAASSSIIANYYPVDMFVIGGANAGVGQTSQIFSPTPGGSSYRIRVAVTTADTSVAAGDYQQITHTIEGLRSSDLRWGSAAAKTVTLQFGVKAPAGTYCITLSNATGNRSYVAEYVIAAGEANTDVVRSLVIPGDTSGTWAFDNTGGITVHWGLMAGTTFQQTAGSWGTGNVIGSANQFNFIGQTAAFFELFDVSLTEGTVAPPFQVPDYASELALCRRYYSRKVFWNSGYATAGGSFSTWFAHGVVMRAAPTVTPFGGTVTNATGPGTCDQIQTDGYRHYFLATATGMIYVDGVTVFTNARL